MVSTLALQERHELGLALDRGRDAVLCQPSQRHRLRQRPADFRRQPRGDGGRLVGRAAQPQEVFASSPGKPISVMVGTMALRASEVIAEARSRPAATQS